MEVQPAGLIEEKGGGGQPKIRAENKKKTKKGKQVIHLPCLPFARLQSCSLPCRRSREISLLLFIPAHPPSAPIRKDRANLTEASRGGVCWEEKTG